MIKYITERQQKSLDGLFEKGIDKIEIANECWIDDDKSFECCSYCHACGEKKLEQIKKEYPDDDIYLSGGCGNVEGDSIPYCETCGILLENVLTDYACEEEINHFICEGFDPDDGYDCHSMERVVCHMGWRIWKDTEYRNDFDRNLNESRYVRLHQLCRLILAELDGKVVQTWNIKCSGLKNLGKCITAVESCNVPLVKVDYSSEHDDEMEIVIKVVKGGFGKFMNDFKKTESYKLGKFETLLEK